ncbi:hypothetical protein [Roseococcus pinisoli]|uniref:Uncharacterized protein n=1 Tax=Roseococcus pinisoli TaxID=2835040 RepID=A0ABS5QF79_9PROT|nr:hypothetical protein [Roseococcus pinisoli]MBS7812355.1 hypothetical protein [Roseococcus pinisoli]
MPIAYLTAAATFARGHMIWANGPAKEGPRGVFTSPTGEPAVGRVVDEKLAEELELSGYFTIAAEPINAPRPAVFEPVSEPAPAAPAPESTASATIAVPEAPTPPVALPPVAEPSPATPGSRVKIIKPPIPAPAPAEAKDEDPAVPV